MFKGQIVIYEQNLRYAPKESTSLYFIMGRTMVFCSMEERWWMYKNEGATFKESNYGRDIVFWSGGYLRSKSDDGWKWVNCQLLVEIMCFPSMNEHQRECMIHSYSIWHIVFVGHLRLATMMGEDWHGLDSIGPGFFHFFLKFRSFSAEGSEGNPSWQVPLFDSFCGVRYLDLMEYFKRWDGFTREEAAELLTIFKRRWTAERNFGRLEWLDG